jgi:hypothetical protein|nr:MAG TPA: hypothetical protein [Caudoviricetes sp.]
MCEYCDVAKGKCRANGEVCPYVYFCTKARANRVSKHMPSNCKVKLNAEVPKGSYRVAYERKGKLYVDVKNQIVIVDNIYDFTPLYVKLYKSGGKWRIRK